MLIIVYIIYIDLYLVQYKSMIIYNEMTKYVIYLYRLRPLDVYGNNSMVVF